MVYGFIFALLTAIANRFKLIDDTSKTYLWSQTITIIVSFLSFSGLMGYTVFAFYCGIKEHCNEVHTYVVFFPVSVVKQYYISLPTKYFTNDISDSWLYSFKKLIWIFEIKVFKFFCLVWTNQLGTFCSSISYMVVSRHSW